MKRWIETLAVTFGMFSRVPVPQVEWTKENRRYTLLAFPLVGLVLGVCWVALAALGESVGVPPVLTAALMTALPLLVTGGIHLDGYADTVDALSSHGEREQKLAILKDPHVGSFAVIHLAVYVLLWAAATTVLLEAYGEVLVVTGLIFVLSRALSALAVTSFPMAQESGLASSFAEDADRKRVRTGLIVLMVLLVLVFGAIDFVAGAFPAGLMVCGVAAVLFVWYRYISEKHLGGINGDFAGWFLCRCELWCLVAAAVAGTV